MIRRALISVWDKTGIVEFARALHEEFGIEIISTGGTATALTDAGIPVTLVEALTGCGEMLGGRVKTLHPAIHAAILADRDNPEHMRQLEAAGIKPIDMVVVNLYPFEKTVADPNCTFEQAIEMIDIGGVALLRAAAKNHKHVVIISQHGLGTALLEILRGDGSQTIEALANVCALRAFMQTAAYDSAIMEWLSRDAHARRTFWSPLLCSVQTLRYGENPHQTAETAVQSLRPRKIDLAIADRIAESSLGNKAPMSFNNFVDADAALGLCAELTRAASRTAKLRFAPAQPSPNEPNRTAKLRFASPPAQSEDRSRTAKLRFAPIREEHRSRRNLPHWQVPGATYWVSFSSRIGELSPAERTIAFDAIRFWDGKRIDVHAAVVMPDHVHILLTPTQIAGRPGEFENLSAIMQSVKSFSGREISKLRGGIGVAWVHESYDHWIRDAGEFRQKWEYVAENVVKERLARTPPEYAWWYGVDYFDLGIGVPVGTSTPIPGVLSNGGEGARSKAELCSTGEAGSSKAELCSSGEGVGRKAERSIAGLSKAELCSTGCDDDSRVAVFIKHTNACGVGIATESRDGPGGVPDARLEAYRRAYLGDPNAAMGGILACNFPVDAEFAAAVMETYDRFGKPLKEAGAAFAPGGFFVEVWIAPAFDDDAVEIIRGTYDPEKIRAAALSRIDQSEQLEANNATSAAIIQNPPRKKWGENVRLLAVGDMSVPPDPDELQYRSIAGGMLVQSPDLLGLNEEQWKVATKRAPSDAEMADLRLAWLICKHTKSNAISLVKDGILIGNGAGQMSRVMSCRIATWLARENGHAEELAGSVAASDAFFPFADGPRILIDAGVTALIQPGGSKRDDETIALCDERNVAMIFTGTRHFRH